jgi:hypothetical protein
VSNTANVTVNYIAEASPVTVLPDGRLRLVRRWEVIGDFTIPSVIQAALFVPEGTADGNLNAAPGSLQLFPATIQGTPSKFYPQCALIAQALDGIKGVQGKGVLTQTYEQLPAYPTETDAPEPIDIKNANVGITVIATTGSMTISTQTLTVASRGNWDIGAQVNVAGAISAATIIAIDATGLVWTLSANASATVAAAAVTGVSTTVDGVTVTGYFRQAREFKMKLIVAGLGSNFCPAKSAPYFASLPTGVPQRYFIGQTVEQHGTVFANITRIYRELPCNRVYTRWIEWTVPGSMGVANFPPMTEKALATITESYSIANQAPSALTFVPLQWLSITTTYTDSGSGDTYIVTANYEGYLNDSYGWTGTATTGVINGFSYDEVSASGTSVLCTDTGTGATTGGFPTGTFVIHSEVDFWNGNKRMGEVGEMTRKIDTQITLT